MSVCPASTAHEGRPDTENLTEDGEAIQDESALDKREAKLLSELNESLHDLSQPMTVLLCALEYGVSVDAVEEMREMVKVSQEACERLLNTTVVMRARVREAIEGRAARHGRLTQ